MSKKKAVYFPLQPHILKFVKRGARYGFIKGVRHRLIVNGSIYKDQLTVSGRLFKPQKSNAVIKKYFDRLPTDLPWVNIIMERPTKARLFALKNDLESDFANALFSEILRTKSDGKSASEGIRKFLIMNGLTEEEYSFDTAHRRWMRYQRTWKYDEDNKLAIQ